jgi:hypothetical protein
VYDGDSGNVRIEIFVPHKSNLRIVTNGEIRLDGVSGEIELRGTDGAINVRDADGKLTVANADGRIRVIGFRGQLDAKTTDGDVYLEGDFTKIFARATDGTFVLTVPEDASADIKAKTDEITIEDLPMLKQIAGGTWRIGKGAADYNFVFIDGKLVVRNASLVNSY